MKKTYLISLFTFLIAASNSQIHYSLSASQDTYIPLTRATYVPLYLSCISSFSGPDDGYCNNISIGFNFKFNGNNFTRVNVCTNGFLTFGQGFATSHERILYNTHNLKRSLLYDTIKNGIIAPFWSDLDVQNQQIGGIRYKTTGVYPNRVFVIEWVNVLWDYSANNGCLSFQVKLYETSNKIDFIYNRQNGGFTNSDTSKKLEAAIGISNGKRGAGNFISLRDSSSNPGYSKAWESSIYGRPETDQVYTFTPDSLHNNDAEVTAVIGTPIIARNADPQKITAIVMNNSIDTLSNIKVTLKVTGAINYTSVRTIPKLAVNTPNYLDFIPPMASGKGNSSFVVSIGPDGDSSNNQQIFNQKVSEGTILYHEDDNDTWGISYINTTKETATRITNPNTHGINRLLLYFAVNPNGPQGFSVAIYDTTGFSKDSTTAAPGALLWTSATFQSNHNGPISVPINPSLTIKGDFFVVVSQHSADTLLNYAYEKAAPINFSTFFIKNAGNAWLDLANLDLPCTPFRLKVGVQFDSTTTLPVNILSFSGVQEPKGCNILSWSTTNEINNSGFELQRSNDGKIFSTVNFIPSKFIDKKVGSKCQYSVADKSPSDEKLYYRLKQIDNNGKYAFSTVIAINPEKPIGLFISTIFPNPTKDAIAIKLTSPSETPSATLRVRDLNGRIVLQQIVPIMAGENNLTLPLNSLNAGSYVLQVELKESISCAAKFVKIK